ncbi:MAG: hypothetical protein F6K26_38855 [Moorea sp. SIO2I5]|nr:hypothetical protein [Moorena sp. SIO2I5]
MLYQREQGTGNREQGVGSREKGIKIIAIHLGLVYITFYSDLIVLLTDAIAF